MTVVNMQGKIMEEVRMQPVFSNPNQPIFNHGDRVEVIGSRPRIVGSIRGRTYGREPDGIIPSYGVFPDGVVSWRDAITVAQDRLVQVHIDFQSSNQT